MISEFLGEWTIHQECAICIDTFNAHSECWVLSCYHTFHTTCIDNWLWSWLECPMCKKQFDKAENLEYKHDRKAQKWTFIKREYWPSVHSTYDGNTTELTAVSNEEWVSSYGSPADSSLNFTFHLWSSDHPVQFQNFYHVEPNQSRSSDQTRITVLSSPRS